MISTSFSFSSFSEDFFFLLDIVFFLGFSLSSSDISITSMASSPASFDLPFFLFNFLFLFLISLVSSPSSFFSLFSSLFSFLFFFFFFLPKPNFLAISFFFLCSRKIFLFSRLSKNFLSKRSPSKTFNDGIKSKTYQNPIKIYYYIIIYLCYMQIIYIYII